MSEQTGMQLGIDVGGTSIRGAVVDLATGELAGAIRSEPTPETATPGDVVAAIGASRRRWAGPARSAWPCRA